MRFTTLLAAVLTIAIAAPAAAQSVVRPAATGMTVIHTEKDYETLLSDLKAAVQDNNMGIVTEAGPTEMAAQRGEEIAGNRVVGVFRNDFAVTIIREVPAAMIEAPVRFMVMEEPDGTASLSYLPPSVRFAPYADEGGETLADVASQMDEIFAAIAEAATTE